jgi:hypothetical protein
MKLPQHPQIQEAYAQLRLEDRMVFEHAYALRSKGVGATYLAWLVGSHYVYLGRQKVQFAYWFTAGGLLLWALADLFRIPGMVNGVNTTVALNALKPFERHPEITSDDFEGDDLEVAAMLEPAWINPTQINSARINSARIEPTHIEPKWITPTQSQSAQLEPVPTNHAVIELVFQ